MLRSLSLIFLSLFSANTKADDICPGVDPPIFDYFISCPPLICDNARCLVMDYQCWSEKSDRYTHECGQLAVMYLEEISRLQHETIDKVNAAKRDFYLCVNSTPFNRSACQQAYCLNVKQIYISAEAENVHIRSIYEQTMQTLREQICSEILQECCKPIFPPIY